MHRTFIAVKIKPEERLSQFINTLKQELREEKIRWVDPENIHITLAFLGDTNEDDISGIKEMLKTRCSGFGEVDFILKGAGVFKNLNDPRVIWTGLDKAETLSELHKIIIKGIIEIGIESEDRDFRPHLTLGRVKWINNKSRLKDLIERFAGTEFQDVIVPEVVFFESILNHEGAVYKPLLICKL